MITKDRFVELLKRLRTNHKNGAVISEREVLEDLLVVLLEDAPETLPVDPPNPPAKK